MKPNIFNFATKELSQDAFLCYLLEFSKEGYKKYEKEHIFAPSKPTVLSLFF